MIEEKLNPILVANLKALDERQPLFAQKVRDYMKNTKDRFSINARETPRGTWFSGLYEQPFFEPSSCLDATPEGTKPVLIMAGLGSPRYLTGILNNSKKRQTIVLLEPNMRMMMFALESVPFFGEKRPAQLYFLTEDDHDSVDELVKKAYGTRGTLVGGYFDVHSHPGEAELMSDETKKLLAVYVDRIHHQMMRLGDSAEDTLLGVRQMALSTPWILSRESLEPLKGSFRGYSGVVLAAGPSLDKNINLIKGLEDKLVIVAADTLIGKLSSLGIKPHFVCAIERGDATYEKYFRPYYDKNDPFLDDITLVVQSVCFPHIAGRWPGPICVVGKDSINMDQIIIDDILGGTVLPSGASVAHMGMGILSYLGVDKIALVGQDLAFGEDGSTHTMGTAWGSGGLEKQDERLLVPGSMGGYVETVKIWKFFMDTFEVMIPKMSCPVWDCTEGGALITGTKIAPLSDFIADLDGCREGTFSLVKDSLGGGGDENRLSSAEKGLNSLRSTFVQSLESVEKGRAMLSKIKLLSVKDDNLESEISSFYDLLQKLTEKNAILTYIGQSYLSTLVVEQSKFYSHSDEERLNSWIKAHEEYFDSQQRSAEVFIIWLDYMYASVRLYDSFTSRNVHKAPDIPSLKEELELLLQKSEDRGLAMEDILLVDFLHARLDPVSRRWNPMVLWAMGRHMNGEGRFLEASKYFDVLIDEMSEQAIDPKGAVELLKDRTRALMGRDLCWIGRSKEALESLANAYGYDQSDEEIPRILLSLLHRRREDLDDMIIKETRQSNREALAAMVKGLNREIERLEGNESDRADVIERYLVKILQEKSSSPIDSDPIKEVGEGD
nr:6-hydroxymethylpterin diphosphokinase MptE-like protein [uncultured Dethiosulfovibrio sp.]